MRLPRFDRFFGNTDDTRPAHRGTEPIRADSADRGQQAASRASELDLLAQRTRRPSGRFVAEPLNTQSTHPLDIAGNAALAEAGIGYETLLAMQRDPHIAACLQTRQNAILSRRVSYTGDSEALSEAVARLEGGISGVLRGALDALAMGWAVGEFNGPESGSRRVRWHDVRRFGRTRAGDLLLRDRLDRDGVRAQPLPHDRFLVFVHRARWCEPYGRSDLLTVVDSWRRKQRKLDLWMAALERHGIPTPVATVPAHWDTNRRQTLANALGTLAWDGALVVEEGVAVALPLDRTHAGEMGFADAIEMENREMARALLGQELTVQSSGGGERSLALAQVQERTARLWFDALATEIETQVLAPLALWLLSDLPDGAPRGTLVFAESSEETHR